MGANRTSSGRRPAARRLAAFALATALLGGAAEAACSGQAGTMVANDSFTSNDGSWVADDAAVFGSGGLRLTLTDPYGSWVFWNEKVFLPAGDFCMEVVQPQNAAADNVAAVGIATLIVDADNYYMLQLASDNTITLWRKRAGIWVKIDDYTSAAPPLRPGDIQTMQMVVRDGAITSFVNGKRLGRVRAQSVGQSLRFGVYAQTASILPAPGMSFTFRRVSVTDSGPGGVPAGGEVISIRGPGVGPRPISPGGRPGARPGPAGAAAPRP